VYIFAYYRGWLGIFYAFRGRVLHLENVSVLFYNTVQRLVCEMYATMRQLLIYIPTPGIANLMIAIDWSIFLGI